ncbi:MAG: thioredoxin family protein [Pirellulales bacterium]|nr:thioredoxin family protein [Pirellulales bacterium]
MSSSKLPFALACFVFIVVAQISTPSTGQEVVGTEDFENASKQAAETGKHVMLNFTGSDWCRYCVWMEQTVFSTEDFAKYANENLVCVTLDFPNQKPQSEEIKKQNAALQEKYKVGGFPTYVVLNSQGEKVAQLSTTSWAWRFVEKLDAAIHPEKHQVDVFWLEDEDFDKDIDAAVAKAAKSNKLVLHFLDSSSYSSFPRDVKRDAFSSTLFKQYAQERLVLLSTPISTMFNPVDSLEGESKAKLISYASQRYGKDEKELTRKELDSCCISQAEFSLKESYGVNRSTLPAIAILNAKGERLKMITKDELSKLYHEDGAKSILREIESVRSQQ